MPGQQSQAEASILVCLFTLALITYPLCSLVFLIPFDRAPEVILDGRHGRLQTRCGVRYEVARLRLGRVDWMDSRMSAWGSLRRHHRRESHGDGVLTGSSALSDLYVTRRRRGWWRKFDSQMSKAKLSDATRPR